MNSFYLHHFVFKEVYLYDTFPRINGPKSRCMVQLCCQRLTLIIRYITVIYRALYIYNYSHLAQVNPGCRVNSTDVIKKYWSLSTHFIVSIRGASMGNRNSNNFYHTQVDGTMFIGSVGRISKSFRRFFKWHVSLPSAFLPLTPNIHPPWGARPPLHSSTLGAHSETLSLMGLAKTLEQRTVL